MKPAKPELHVIEEHLERIDVDFVVPLFCSEDMLRKCKMMLRNLRAVDAELQKIDIRARNSERFSNLECVLLSKVGNAEKRLKEANDSFLASAVLVDMKHKYSYYTLNVIDRNAPITNKTIGEAFFRLGLVEHDKEEEKKAAKENVQRAIEFEQKQKRVSLSDMDPSAKSILIQGRAGMGKTNLCKYICHQWSKGELWNDRFDLIIHVVLVELAGEDLLTSKMTDIMKNQIGHDLMKWSKRANVLWIFDGYDEVQNVIKPGTDLYKWIVERRGDCAVLVTTRPEVKESLERDLCVECIGFSDEDIDNYVKSFFEQEEESKIVLSLLSRNEWLRNAAKTPINLELICFGAKEHVLEDKIRMTGIYRVVIKKLMEKASDFTQSEKEKAKKELRRIAYETLKEAQGFIKNSTMSEDENIVKYIEQTGLVKKALTGGYFWSHFTFQEFLAAECVVFDLSEANADVWEEIGDRSVVFALFVCGLCRKDSELFESVGDAICDEGFSADTILRLMSENNDLHDEVCSRWRESLPKNSDDLLQEASYLNDKAVVELLLEKGGDPNDGMRAAVEEGHLEILKMLLDKGAEPNSEMEDVASYGHVAILEILLDNGADPSEGIYGAARKGRIEIVKMLLEKGADPSEGIYGAARKGHVETVKMLLEHGADPNKVVDGAARNGHIEIVKLLLEKEGDPNTGMKVAVENGHIEIVKLLVDKGADPSEGLRLAAVWEDHIEIIKTLLHKGADPSEGIYGAARKGHVGIVKMLLEKGGDPSIGMKVAVENGHIEIVKMLLEHGADPNKGMYEAAWNGHIEMVKLLVDKGADPKEGMYGAVVEGHVEIVKMLLDKGADPNNGVCGTVGKCHIEIVKMLLDKGADPSIGMTGAAWNGYIEIVKMLLEKGVDPNKGMYGAARGHEEIVKMLLDKGADPNEGMDGAARNGHIEIVKMLLDKGADPNEGMEGAGSEGNEKMVKLLMDKGADPNKGMDRAARNGHIEILKLLLNRGADPNNGVYGAADRGRVEIVKMLLDKGADPNKGMKVAVEKGYVEIVKMLLDKGADPKEHLSLAARKDHIEIVKMLLEEDAYPNIPKKL